MQGTLAALGLRLRMQTVYHAHTPEAVGVILAVKELIEVRNVPASAVRTAGQREWRGSQRAGMLCLGRRSGLGDWYVWA